ncbi:MAG: hypothetical protein GX811_04460 [Lentisphaerae bacterium]|nr:hypothetical protein [Lentisphaerota bacterium]
MPVYESIKNADNKIVISTVNRESVTFGWDNVVDRLVGLLDSTSQNIAIDGWYGIDFAKIANALANKLQAKGLKVELYAAHQLFKTRDAIIAYNAPYVTDDPGFGKVNKTGVLEDIMESATIADLKAKLDSDAVVIAYGEGVCIRELADRYAVKTYVDNTHQKVQWDMWEGKLNTFGQTSPTKDYNWKEYNYSDYYLLKRQKDFMYDTMDFYIENYFDNDLVLVPRVAYDEIMATLVKYPIHEVKIFSPGPWGAYRFHDMDYGVEGLANNAWNKIAGPELRILIDFGGDRSISIPMLNAMQYGKELVGELIDKQYPGLFPLDVWLDDGYHKSPQPAERISMPMHIHPSSQYVEQHFDEPLGRYETYYIAEAYEGANTWIGFHDETEIEEWGRVCEESNNIRPIGNWKDFIANWPSKEGDLYLIPPGTMHGHGGNQMVLEMDTNPSINGTEYSFFEYDFARHSWDDNAKSMTGKPLKMHLEHARNMEKTRRASWVKDHLLSTPTVVKWTKEYFIDRYKSTPVMPYHVERIHFEKTGEYSTEGKFMHMLTLTVGSKVTVRSKTNNENFAICDKFQTLVVPATFGDYEIINEEGGRATCVIQRWKKG